MVDGLILYNGRVYISSASALGPTSLELVHGAVHEGVHKALHRLRADFHFPKDRVVVQNFVWSCAVCQKDKSEHLHPGGCSSRSTEILRNKRRCCLLFSMGVWWSSLQRCCVGAWPVGVGTRELLVRWKGAPASETSWVDLEEFKTQFPAFQLEDELLLQGGRDVMWGLRYGRRNRKGQAVDN